MGETFKENWQNNVKKTKKAMLWKLKNEKHLEKNSDEKLECDKELLGQFSSRSYEKYLGRPTHECN